MPESALGGLSIGALKSILFQNHVTARLVVEKDELVAKVRALLDAERSDRARHAADEEAERVALEEARREREQGAAARPSATADYAEGAGTDAMEVDVHDHDHDGDVHMQEGTSAESPPRPPPKSGPPPPPKSAPASPPPPSRLSPSAQAMASHLERTGLCVICQDEEANIAIVDCG